MRIKGRRMKATTHLCACHDVSAGGDDGNGVFLNRRGFGVVGESDGHGDDLAEHAFGELFHGAGTILARHLHRDVVVLVEVDSSQVTAEQL